MRGRYARRGMAWPTLPTPTRDCSRCGWTHYPRPEAVPGGAMTVSWTLPAACDFCGGRLELERPSRDRRICATLD